MDSFDRDDGFAHDLALLHAPQDLRAAQALAQALAAQGATLAWRPGQPPEGGRLDDELARTRWVLLLWSAAVAELPEQVDRARLALQRHALMPLRLDPTALPPGLERVPVVALSGWQGDTAEPVFTGLMRALMPLVLPPRSPAGPPAVAAPAAEPRRWWQVWRRDPEPAPDLRGSLRQALGPPEEPFERTVPLIRPPLAGLPEAVAEPALRRSDLAPPRDDGLPVWVGAAAPRHAAPGQHFAVRLGLFTEPMRERMLAVLAHLADEAELAPRPDAPASVWLAGAPITIAIDGGPDLVVSPPLRRLSWNGQSDLASFNVSVNPGTPMGPQTLHLQVLLAGLPLAYLSLPLRIERANMATALAVPVVELPRPLPRSLWVAVATADAATVAERVSQALAQAPGLRLRAGDAMHTVAERERAMAACDAMLLCWSLAAVTDAEVIRMLRHGWSRLGPEAVLPMPLADPEAVWPPQEFSEGQWLERYRMAWAALAPPLELQLADEPETEVGPLSRR
ncbi:hypothetical protein KAK06_15490 [Ideonella sp. 4Y11]|uniref:TIR domain-containing protein n=1 Tax=Ideonella aquatica TaxID=2824119 RepID=A0A941BKX3_9BURK|nr:hypothetical protein [Ideonella aquatica]MBQ0960358.1 hypothetical protein [Ideonella aquatica]